MDVLEKEIRDQLEARLDIRTVEKEELGEVFTPLSMIDNLYDNFPAAVWTDSTKKWLDPAAGTGNFPVVLFFKLMKGLAKRISSARERAKHIVENMIYMVEINKSSAAKCERIFKHLCADAKPNIVSGDFLKLSSGDEGFQHKEWPTHFDCVIGNPPYNIGGTKLEGTKRAHITFTKHALAILNNAGFVAYICPPSYREAQSPMNNLFKEAGGHLVYIKIYGAEETATLFHIQGRVDGFIYQRDKKGTTVIDDEYDIHTTGIALDFDQHIPNFGHTIFKKLLTKVKQLGYVDAYRNTEASTVKAATFGCGGRHKILHLIVAKGRRVYKSAKKHSLEGVPKILVNGLGVPYVYYDEKGEYGPSQTPVIIERPSAKLVQFMLSDFFSFMAWGLRLTGNNTLPYMFKYVPAIKGGVGPLKSVRNIGEWLGLTEAEMKFISDNFSKYTYEDADLIEPCIGRNTTRKIKK